MSKTKERLIRVFKNEEDYRLISVIDEVKTSSLRIKVLHVSCGTEFEPIVANFLNKGSRCPNNDCVQQRKRKTNLEKYGVGNPMKTPEVLKKQKEAFKKLYASDRKDEIVAKRRATCKERYGVDNISKLEETKEKRKATCLERCGHEAVLNNEEIREKREKTCLEKYGSKHQWRNNKVREKIRKTFQERYGVDNSFQSGPIKDKSIDTIRRTNYAKYELLWIKEKVTPQFTIDEYTGVRDSEYRFACDKCNNSFSQRLDGTNVGYAICRVCNPRKYRTPKQEQELQDFIEQHTKIERNKRFKKDNSHYELDVFIPGLNIGYEMNGVYWHSELGGNKSRNYHVDKTDFFKSLGIQIYHIYDFEWDQKQSILKSSILSRLKKNNKVFARKCVIKDVDTKQAREFLDHNHIQGYVNAKEKYGLFYENELVSLMTFGISRFDKKSDYEMLRFCSKQGGTVVGGFSRLLKHFTKNHEGKLISYADRRYSDGNVYSENGFVLVRKSEPGYSYIKTPYSNLMNRQKFQKHKLPSLLESFDPQKTEWENMVDNGYDRIWDCGNYVYELTI